VNYYTTMSDCGIIMMQSIYLLHTTRSFHNKRILGIGKDG
jgi:hypothetical protein